MFRQHSNKNKPPLEFVKGLQELKSNLVQRNNRHMDENTQLI